MISDFIELARLIAKFQALESGLKVVLVQHRIAEDRKTGNLQEGYSLSDVDDLSFGILLKRYKKISQNKDLCNRLLILKDYRNYLAHKSFLAISATSNYFDKDFLGLSSVGYRELNDELDECIIELVKDYKQQVSLV